jgi:hypothetical protein
MTRTSASGQSFWLGVAGLALLAATQAAISRAGHSLSIDEPFTAKALMLSWTSILDRVVVHDNVPLYYALLKIWTTMVGVTEWTLRTPSLAAFGLTVVPIGTAGRMAWGASGGLVSAMLAATSTGVGLMHAATARTYALCCLLAATTAVVCVRWMRGSGRNHRRLALALFAVELAGLFAHPVFAVLVLTTIMCLPTAVPRGQTAWAVAAPAAAVLVYLAVWGHVLVASAALPATAWMTAPDVRAFVQAWLNLWDPRVGLVLAGVLGALLLAAGDIKAFREDPTLRFLTLVGALMVLITWTISQWRPIFHPHRTMAFVLPFAALAVGGVLARLATRLLLTATLGLCVAASLYQAIGAWTREDPAPTRASLQTLLGRARCGDAIVVAGLAYAGVEFYAPRLDAPSCIERAVFPADMADHSGWIDVHALTSSDGRAALAVEAGQLAARLAGGHDRVWVVGLSGVDGTVGFQATAIIERALARELPTVERYGWTGSFFDQVQRFERRR